MTNNQDLFKELDRTVISKVKIENGDYIDVKGKKIVVLNSLSGLKYKYISDILYMSDIDQNLLSVVQLMEKCFKIIFKDQWCLIKDNLDNNVFRVKMKAKGLMTDVYAKTYSCKRSSTIGEQISQLRSMSACQYRK
jgi:hypothetical protein